MLEAELERAEDRGDAAESWVFHLTKKSILR